MKENIFQNRFNNQRNQIINDDVIKEMDLSCFKIWCNNKKNSGFIFLLHFYVHYVHTVFTYDFIMK